MLSDSYFLYFILYIFIYVINGVKARNKEIMFGDKFGVMWWILGFVIFLLKKFAPYFLVIKSNYNFAIISCE